MRIPRPLVAAFTAVFATAVLAACVTVDPVTGSPDLVVAGNRLTDGHGTTLQLRGVNRSGAEYTCAESGGTFDGPTDDPTSIAAIKSWDVNTVRIPLNEDCWLGINGLPKGETAAQYQANIVSYVTDLNAAGIVAVLDLQETGPGTVKPDSIQEPMADLDHSPTFWVQVAHTFAGNPSVMFDVFTEPFNPANSSDDSTGFWTCIRNGSTAANTAPCSTIPYAVAGMNTLIGAVRFGGGHQPIIVDGPSYAGNVDKWVATGFVDSQSPAQLVAGVHIYGLPLDSPDRTTAARNTDTATVLAAVPLYVGEFGDTDCTTNFSPGLMSWADTNGASYTAWSWVTSNCANEPALITSYNGTATTYGAGVKSHLVGLGNEW